MGATSSDCLRGYAHAECEGGDWSLDVLGIPKRRRVDHTNLLNADYAVNHAPPFRIKDRTPGQLPNIRLEIWQPTVRLTSRMGDAFGMLCDCVCDVMLGISK